MEEGQTTQWPKYDLQNTTHKTKDQGTRTPLKIQGQCGATFEGALNTILFTNLL